MHKLGLFAFTATTLNLFAADPWIGSWRGVSATFRLAPPAQAVIKPRPNGLVFESTNGNLMTTWSADFDGRDYPLSGATAADYVSLRRVNQNSFEVTRKRAGKKVGASLYTLSPDGKEISSASTNPMYDYKYVYERTAGGAAGATGFAGHWTVNYDKYQTAPTYTATLEPDGPNGLRYSLPNGMAWTAQFDGKEHLLATNFQAWQSVSLRRLDARTFEVTAQRAKMGPHMWRITVSEDNRELTLKSWGSSPTGAAFTMEEVFRRQ